MNAISEKGIGLVIDAGANRGQWALELIESGYKGKIHSFEPTSEFRFLQDLSNPYSNWKCHQVALSDTSGSAGLFQASNANLSTSLLRPSGINEQGFGITFAEGERVKTITLDDFFSQRELQPFYLKLDVQGAEMLVLKGANSVLKSCLAVEFESALFPLYDTEWTHHEIASWLIQRGFEPKQLVITHWDRDLNTVSLDSIFLRDGNVK